MTANNRAISLAGLLLALVVTPRAGATLTKAATFDEKVSNSAAIVLGHVVRQEAKWDDQHRWILTYTTFQIEKAFKGVPGQQEITIVTPGGRVGNLRLGRCALPDDGDAHVRGAPGGSRPRPRVGRRSP